MERTYPTGFVYKITNSFNDHFYIGSTRRSLGARLNGHFQEAFVAMETKPISALIRELGREKFRIEPIELLVNCTVHQLWKREQYHIDLLKPVLNVRPALSRFRAAHLEAGGSFTEEDVPSSASYYEKHRTYILKRVHDYAVHNREKVLQNKRDYCVLENTRGGYSCASAVIL